MASWVSLRSKKSTVLKPSDLEGKKLNKTFLFHLHLVPFLNIALNSFTKGAGRSRCLEACPFRRFIFFSPKNNTNPGYHTEAQTVSNVNPEHTESPPLRDQVLKFIQTCDKHPQSRGTATASHVSWNPF